MGLVKVKVDHRIDSIYSRRDGDKGNSVIYVGVANTREAGCLTNG